MSAALVLEYVNDPRAYAAQQSFQQASAWAAARRRHYVSAITWTLVLVLASYAAIRAELVVLLFGFVVLLIIQVANAYPYGRIQRRAIEAATKDLPTRRIRLIADERGLHETVEDIESFAPWTSVRSFTLFDDVLFIELKARLWAMIPRHGLQGSSASLEQLMELLRARGVVDQASVNVA